MTIKDSLSRIGDACRHRWMYRKIANPSAGGPPAAGRWRGMLWGGARLRRALIALAVLLFLIYPLGAAFIHQIDDDIAFRAPSDDTVAGGSETVAIVSALIDREVNQKRWVANDPFFMPSSLLDNMPNFQQGIIAALARFTFELTDQLGRTRGSSQADPDLQSASGSLQYAGDVWFWNFSVSLLPQASAEAKYREARSALRAYNSRLGAGAAVFDKRSDNLLATIDRIALDLGSSSAALDRAVVGQSGGLIDTQADDLFYSVKGQVYAYALILRALGQDFETLIAERDLTAPWEQMLDSLNKAAGLQPWVVINGAPDSQFLPSHLAAQGFYLLRARTQLREITNILLK